VGGQRSLAFIDQYIGNLKQYKAIAIDVGDQDGLRVDARKLHDILDSYGIPNAFESIPARILAPSRSSSRIS
jgi:hypothetical protein